MVLIAGTSAAAASNPPAPAEKHERPRTTAKSTSTTETAKRPPAVTQKAQPAEQPKRADVEEGDADNPAAMAKATEVAKSAAAKNAPAGDGEAMSPDRALTMLVEGNSRWVDGKPENPNVDPSRRAELAERGQTPFAIVLTCADSRLPVERIFDRGVGEVFVTRVAGNVASAEGAGSIEYAVAHLKSRLIVVMGHTKCGAVKAAMGPADPHGSPNLARLIENIVPAVERARSQSPGESDEAVLSAAERENVWESIYDLLKTSPELRGRAQRNEIRVVGAVCDISTGKVSFMGEHPWQKQLIAAMNGGSNTAHADAQSPRHDEPPADEHR